MMSTGSRTRLSPWFTLGIVPVVLIGLLTACAGKSEPPVVAPDTPSAPAESPSPTPTSRFIMPTTCADLDAGLFQEQREISDVVNIQGPDILNEGYYWSDELALMQTLGGVRCGYVEYQKGTDIGIDGSGKILAVVPLARGDRAQVEALLQETGYGIVDSGSPARSAYAIIGAYQSEYDPSTLHVVGDEVWISVGQNFTAELDEVQAWASLVAANVGAW